MIIKKVLWFCLSLSKCLDKFWDITMAKAAVLADKKYKETDEELKIKNTFKII